MLVLTKLCFVQKKKKKVLISKTLSSVVRWRNTVEVEDCAVCSSSSSCTHSSSESSYGWVLVQAMEFTGLVQLSLSFF